MRALSRSEALGGLRERDLTVIALRSSPPSFLRGLPFNTTPLRDRTAFFRAYAALEDAGVDFSTSFALLTAQATSRRFREALSAIRSGVEQRGEKLWAAMAQRPEEFSELDVAMIAAGEQAGTRKEVLEQIADVLERNERVRKRLLAVLTYPAVVLASAFGLCAYVLVSVVPQFAQLFLSFGVSPPPILRVLLAVSQGFTTWSLAVVAGLAAGLAIFAKRLYATSDGRRLVETSILRIPLVGRIVSTAAVARVSTVLAAL
ncbi:MAG: type II secretion system F family protein, partial [Candidatus Eremiobacteraeota bacterium]|nr:type II secretion system F family protein [Candidatus Eremiobacteraeota bacterium]